MKRTKSSNSASGRSLKANESAVVGILGNTSKFVVAELLNYITDILDKYNLKYLIEKIWRYIPNSKTNQLYVPNPI
ncbi:MAG: hypothetical protein IPM96_18370 [Ignavibacteria bacterium]|nr:hypothetical protein [Ignavibacteria bacterium]